MPTKAETIADSLDSLAKAIVTSSKLETTLMDQMGWTAPPLNRHDIAAPISSLAKKVRRLRDDQFGIEYDPTDDVKKIEAIKSNVIPNLWNGNGPAVVNVLQSFLNWEIDSFGDLLFPKEDWESLDKQGLIPKNIARRARSVKTSIESIADRAEDLQKQVDEINSAHEAALSLPSDLESLNEARARIEEIKAIADRSSVAIEAARDSALKMAKEAAESAKEANVLVGNTAEAYQAATTKGLSEAFQIRADRTARSMWVWVAGLIIALGLGAYLGGHRLNLVQQLLEKEASTGLISINVLLALISIAAPVWFAWISTKQLGQRFRLSEDYAFKASVAKAYEGYRREAAKIDESFAARLFSSALDRLEEAPLRFVEAETHGSPWHEILAGRARQEAKKAQAASQQAQAAAAAAEATALTGGQDKSDGDL